MSVSDLYGLVDPAGKIVTDAPKQQTVRLNKVIQVTQLPKSAQRNSPDWRENLSTNGISRLDFFRLGPDEGAFGG